MDSGPLLILAAPLIGSFLGVLVCRLPRGEPVGWSRSRCDVCGTRLTARDLVPLFSFLMLRGRCRHCGAPIARMHPLIELAAIGVAVSARVMIGGDGLWAWCVLGWTLLALAWIDAAWMILPDVLTLPLILTGLARAAWYQPEDLAVNAIGAVVGWGSLTVIGRGYRMLRGRDGLGGGDAKLLAAAGAWLGADRLAMVVLAAAVCAILWVLLTRRQTRMTEPLPFGPWLATAIWAVALTDGG